ncbi:MAG: hypothetical protein ACLFTX_05460 [Thiohalospira sp.]
MNRNLVAAALLGLALGAAYAWLSGQAPDPSAADAVAEDCRPTGQPCRLEADGGAVTLELPADVRTLAPFHLRASLEGFAEVEEVVARFDMSGMDMGENRYRLEPSGEGDEWRVEAMLPVCTADRVDWFVEVTVRHAEGRTRFVFPFEVSER